MVNPPHHFTCLQVSADLGEFARTSTFLQQPVFNSFHSEHEMLRYLKRIENKVRPGTGGLHCGAKC